MDIIWSCVSTVFLCLWSMLHLNVPAPSDTFWNIFWRRARWLLLGILAPEVPMMFACGQWSSAKRSVQEMRELGFNETQWTLSHGLFADMGGIALQLQNEEPFPITAKQVAWLIRHGHIQLPNIREQDIKDKSKADKCTKVIAVFQTTWFMVQMIARGAEGLAITPLELASAALALTSLTTLWFWHSKPLDVHLPYIIHLDRPACSLFPQMKKTSSLSKASAFATEVETVSCDETITDSPLPEVIALPLDEVEDRIYISRKWNSYVLRLILQLDLQRPRLDRIPNDRDPQILGFKQHLTLGIATAAFATIHFIDWHYTFPTHIELVLWRVNCCLMWLLLAVYGSAEVYICWREQYSKLGMETAGAYKMRWPDCLWFLIPAWMYSIARFAVTAQVFLSMRGLPTEAYRQVEWTLLFPHI